MNNTYNLFSKAKEYQDKRKAVIDEYESTVKGLEKMRGSEYYQEETKKAATKKDEAISSLKAEYKPILDSILQEMRTVAENRPLKAPTEEELRIVQALKLRDYDSIPKGNKDLSGIESSLKRVANAVKGNALCLGIVQDVARKNGIHHNFFSVFTGENIPDETLSALFDRIAGRLGDFLSYDTSMASRIAREGHERMYGKLDENNPAHKVLFGESSGFRPIAKRPLFNTKAECFSQLFEIDEKELELFSSCVDN